MEQNHRRRVRKAVRGLTPSLAFRKNYMPYNENNKEVLKMKEDRYEGVYSRPDTGITDVRIFTTLKELSEWISRQIDPVIITDIRPFV